MTYLPYICILFLVLLVVGTFVVTGRMTNRITRRYFRAVKRFSQEQGLHIADDPDQRERFVITGAVEGVPLRVSTGHVSTDGTDSAYRNPTQRIELEAVGPQSWVMHPPLDWRAKERITSPQLPEVEPLVATGDADFDRKMELRATGGQLPAFARIGWLRRVLLGCDLRLGFSHEHRTVIDFADRPLQDGTFDMHLLRRRIFAALALTDPERAERHRELLVEASPTPVVNLSGVPLLAMVLSLIPAGVGYFVLGYPERWMGAVVGAAVGYPLVLLLVGAAGLWIRRFRGRAGR